MARCLILPPSQDTSHRDMGVFNDGLFLLHLVEVEQCSEVGIY